MDNKKNILNFKESDFFSSSSDIFKTFPQESETDNLSSEKFKSINASEIANFIEEVLKFKAKKDTASKKKLIKKVSARTKQIRDIENKSDFSLKETSSEKITNSSITKTSYINWDEKNPLCHSAAHILAHAISIYLPGTKFWHGPAQDNNEFFYDVDPTRPISEKDLPNIEKIMKDLVNQNLRFERFQLSKKEALDFFKSKGEIYKVKTLKEKIKDDDTVSLYKDGNFVDLCRGPHIDSTKRIKAIKLLDVSGSYFEGEQGNKMLTRIRGMAFENEADLKNRLHVIEEAKKRDHRKIGKELDFFSIQEDGGPGLIFYHPKGAFLRHLIEQFVKEEHLKRGYQFVIGPQILKSDIWVKSGHYSYYKENMFIFKTEDEKEYALKPMNCPGHMLIFKTRVRSYRDLPLRFFELGNVCRNEKSGVLHGLLRVRNFTQDDAHIFCMQDALQPEIASVVDFVFYVLDTFGFKEREIEISTRPEGSIGSDEAWEKATAALKGALDSKKVTYKVCEGEGAFYGPKIDIKIKDALGRSWQCSTIQCDFALPERFDLEYTGSDGHKHRPVMLHRAILGSVERFMGTLLEHYSGALPLWLSPVQVSLIPVKDTHKEFAEKISAKLIAVGLRVEIQNPSETLGSRIRLAQTEKVPYMLVLGDKEIQADKIAVRARVQGDLGAMTMDDFLKRTNDELKAKI